MIATHLAPARGFGGVAESSAQLAKEWVAAGLRLKVCASDASVGGVLRTEDVALGPSATVTLYHAHWFPRWGFGLGAPLALWRTCRRASAVYISGIATWPTTLAALICILLGRPFVVAPRAGLMDIPMREIIRRKPLKRLFYRLLTLPSLRRASALHATSLPEAEQLRVRFPTARIELVGNGLRLDDWSALPPRSPDGGLALCYVGRLAEEKGVEPFLRAWMTKAGPRDTMTVVGSGPCESSLRILAKESGGKIVMTGDRDQNGVRAALAECDALVLPSRWESFGNVLAEAMASARPVLVTRGIGWDHLESVGAVLLLDEGPAGQAETIARLAATTHQQRCAMGTTARAYAESAFDIRRTARLLADLVHPAWMGSQPQRQPPTQDNGSGCLSQPGGQDGIQG